MTHSTIILRKTSRRHDERDNSNIKLLEILYRISIIKHNWSCFETKQNITFGPSKKIMCTYRQLYNETVYKREAPFAIPKRSTCPFLETMTSIYCSLISDAVHLPQTLIIC